VRAAGAVRTLAWIKKARPLMERQWAVRREDRPHSIGGLETVFQEIVRRLGHRRFVFRNCARLELILDLMALDLADLASDLRYRELIRAHLASNGGQPAVSRRALDDTGGASLHRALREVEKRLARRRQQNAQAQQRWQARQKQAGKTRHRAPSRRSRRQRASLI
jgi:hypothetical protein